MTGPEPEFVHDCDNCTFLGTSKTVHTVLVTQKVGDAMLSHIQSGFVSIADLHKAIGVRPSIHYDLYFCSKGLPGAKFPTVIARFGNEGPDYKSGLVAAEHDDELALALKLARGLKLVD